jgi:rubrerythrin
MALHKLLSGCIAVENAAASLYRTFADLFPDDKPFWQDLYRDELEHSYWLSGAPNAESIELLPSKDLLPSMELTESTFRFINRNISHIKSNPVTPEESLKIALKLEESMVETFTNELRAHLLASGYESLSEKLIAAERAHVSKIEDRMISKGFLQIS